MESIVKSLGMGIYLLSFLGSEGDLPLENDKVIEVARQLGPVIGVWPDTEIPGHFVIIVSIGYEPSALEASIVASEDGVHVRKIAALHRDEILNERITLLENALSKLGGDDAS